MLRALWRIKCFVSVFPCIARVYNSATDSAMTETVLNNGEIDARKRIPEEDILELVDVTT